LRVYALKIILDLKYRWFAHIFFFSFLLKKKYGTRKQKAVSPEFFL